MTPSLRAAARELSRQALVAVLYFAAAVIGLRIVVIAGQVSPVWLAAGVGLWAVAKFGPRIVPGMFVGAFAAAMTTDAPAGFCLLIAVGNCLEAVIAVTLWRRLFGLRPELDRVADLAGLVVASALSPLGAATVGTIAMVGFGLAPAEMWREVAWVWWLGDAMGALVVAPLLLTFAAASAPIRFEVRRPWEAAALTVMLAGSAAAVFGNLIPSEKTLYSQAFLLFPPALWAALRFGPRGTALATFASSMLALAGTVSGRGPFAHQEVVQGVVVLQLFMAVLVITSHLLAAAFAERQRFEAQLVLTERMASVGMIAAGVGHEINNPLGFVMLNLEMLERELENPKLETTQTRRARELLTDSVYGVRRVRDIVRSLRVLSRDAQLERGRVELNELLELTLGLTRHELKSRGELETSFGAVPPVWANEGRLGQVALNLLVNAIQALPERIDGAVAKVTVRTFTDEDGRAVFEVSDTGGGIPRHLLPRIFEPFFTTKPAGEGTGLGLFICRHIVEEHGGTIEVRSEPGVGTTVRISLPPAPAEEEAAPVVEAPAAPEPPARRRVLVVDDEVRLATSMRLLLQPLHSVEVCTDSRVALERMLSSEPFDVVLCDLQMPGLSGMELWQRVQAKRPELANRMLFISGGAYTDEARGFADQMKERVLVKPVQPEVLLAAIERPPAQGSTPAASPSSRS